MGQGKDRWDSSLPRAAKSHLPVSLPRSLYQHLPSIYTRRGHEQRRTLVCFLPPQNLHPLFSNSTNLGIGGPCADGSQGLLTFSSTPLSGFQAAHLDKSYKAPPNLVSQIFCSYNWRRLWETNKKSSSQTPCLGKPEREKSH